MGRVNGFGHILQSAAAYYFPWLDFAPLQPKRIEPAYLPAWFIDAELRASVWDNAGHSGAANVFLPDAVIPGFTFEPLCRIPFGRPELDPVATVPWRNGLCFLDGYKVICEPFTISPLPLVEFLRSLSLTQTAIGDVCFDGSSVRVISMAAYPVLVPVWIAEYRLSDTNSEPTVSAVLEASTKKSPRTVLTGAPLLRGWRNLWRRTSILKSISYPTVQTLGEHHELTTKPAGDNAAVIALRRENAFKSFEAACLPKISGKTIDWDDLCIREFQWQEAKQNRLYSMARLHAASASTLLDIMDKKSMRELPIRVGGKRFKGDAIQFEASLRMTLRTWE
ncbi:hypothetical protein OBBRIDRAFT_575938 [Obba rivulosa]|uniref:Uncharacterized protein n=1 Tax=Obba rivulosa TaxID=1052685 RepID=A0A8E2DT90_9APHY|nr:hypothetical protein OBBRIDRAFT_575938 [Obba rivulosa]